MLDKPAAIYALKHEPTGKVYVGSTQFIGRRIQMHMEALKRGEHPALGMQEDYDKYGGPYTVHILEVVRAYRPTEREALWMDVLGSRDREHGYNGKDQSKKRTIKGAGVLFPMESGKERDAAKAALAKMVEEQDSILSLWMVRDYPRRNKQGGA